MIRMRHPHRLRLLATSSGGDPEDDAGLIVAIADCLADARAGRIDRRENGEIIAVGSCLWVTMQMESIRPGIEDGDLADVIVDALDRPFATREQARTVVAGLSAIASMAETDDPRIGVRTPAAWQDAIAWGSDNPDRLRDFDKPNRIEIAIDADVDAILPDMTVVSMSEGTLVLSTGWWGGWRIPPFPSDFLEPMPDTMETMRRLAALAALTADAPRVARTAPPEDGSVA
jgi:hypothetical protein